MYNFKTHLVLAMTVFYVLVSNSACSKKCQTLPTDPYPTVTATPWRLVQTTDKTISNLDKYNTLILGFSSDFTLNMKRIENNKEFQTPVATGTWNVDVQGQMIKIQYDTTGQAPQDPNANSGNAASTSNVQPAITYAYKLTNQLELTDQKSGSFYRFVPYQGIVDPDNNCTF